MGLGLGANGGGGLGLTAIIWGLGWLLEDGLSGLLPKTVPMPMVVVSEKEL